MALQVVWFKRDLRLHDHRPLVEAAQRGPVLPLYVAEPELWQRPDSSARQWNFCREALQDLNEALTGLGQPLVVRVGEVVAVLEAAHRRHGIGGLWSHQETGNLWTYERDRKVAAWAKDRGIPWRECASFGVIRGLKDRRGWARAWEQRMAEPLLAPPSALPPLADYPLPLRQALIASEDSRFGWNSGIDLFGTLRSLALGTGGGSGLAQQV
ncbi:deoxyribodipyrimidine photo-lyase, partial [Synechococcus sp. BA-132 BA5]|uniref:deoxyribodipyrimidine photo-lyase n=1 Tax=Synechococcus sp. BA-132 BA5 TaxID=3110252 RepID=UPI002B1F7F9B